MRLDSCPGGYIRIGHGVHPRGTVWQWCLGYPEYEKYRRWNLFMNTTPHDSCSLAETLAYPTSLLLRNADAKRIPNSVASKDKKQFVSKRIIKVETTYLIDIRCVFLQVLTFSSLRWAPLSIALQILLLRGNIRGWWKSFGCQRHIHGCNTIDKILESGKWKLFGMLFTVEVYILLFISDSLYARECIKDAISSLHEISLLVRHHQGLAVKFVLMYQTSSRGK